MSEPDSNEDHIRQYLLGVTSGEERQRFEQRVMVDPAFKEIVLMVEDEMIEDYASGLLSAPERDMFVKGYLTTPHQMRKLKIAKALGESAERYRAAHHSTSQGVVAGVIPRLRSYFKEMNVRRKNRRLIRASVAAFTLVSVLVVSGAMWWWYARHTLIRELHKLNAQQSAGVQLQGAPDVLVSEPLTPTLVRGGAPNAVVIPAGVRVVRLRLGVSELRYGGYRVGLRKVGGDEVIEVDIRTFEKSDGAAAVIVNTPVGLLPPGDYQLTLSGETPGGGHEEIADYAFRVSSRGRP